MKRNSRTEKWDNRLRCVLLLFVGLASILANTTKAGEIQVDPAHTNQEIVVAVDETVTFSAVPDPDNNPGASTIVMTVTADNGATVTTGGPNTDIVTFGSSTEGKKCTVTVNIDHTKDDGNGGTINCTTNKDYTYTIYVPKIKILTPTEEQGGNEVGGASLTRNNYRYASDNKCNIDLEVEILPEETAIESHFENKIRWTITPPAGSTASWENGGSSEGKLVYDSESKTWKEKLTLTTLPANNNQFGRRATNVQFTDDVIGETFPAPVDLFYFRDLKNHPGEGSGQTPNWYFYRSQTDANFGDHEYGGSKPDAAGEHFYQGPDAGKILIYEGAKNGGNGYFSQFQSRQNIDAFATVAIHELKHHTDWEANWDPYDPAQDLDVDIVKDSVESTYTTFNGHEGYDKTKQDSDNDGVNDAEDLASTAENNWTNGDADDEDWCEPGANSAK